MVNTGRLEVQFPTKNEPQYASNEEDSPTEPVRTTSITFIHRRDLHGRLHVSAQRQKEVHVI